MNKPNQPYPWQDILWREWRYCEDEAYAQHLFALVTAAPVRKWPVMLAFVLGGLCYGALGGWLIGLPIALIGLLIESRNSLLSWLVLPVLIGLGAVVGGMGGLCQLSENTLRILQSLFRQVERKAK